MTTDMQLEEVLMQVNNVGIGLKTGYIFGRGTDASPLIPLKLIDKLYPIAKNKGGSLIAIWTTNDSLSVYRQPVVWLDSEGSPNGVIAENLADFLSVIPFGSGLVYEVLFYSLSIKSYPQLYPEPETHFHELSTLEIVCDNNTCKKYTDLISGWEIKLSKDPVTLVRKAINTQGDFDGKLNQ